MTAAPSPLIALVEGRTGEEEEKQILDLLRGARTPEELDALLEGVDLDDLVDSLDNRLLGPKYRTEVVRLLTEERVEDLTIERRAGVVHALQIGRTPFRDEGAIERVITATRGRELTELKNRLNMRSDHRDLEALVYRDIDNPAVRKRILDHIAAEAPRLDPPEAKVLCDIDDTVFSSLHDERYPKGTVVPGVLALLEALDRGPTGEPFSMGDLSFVTARPATSLGVIENHSRESLRKAGITQKTVLTGSLLALRTHDAMAARKVGNVEHYHALFPEYLLVFIGDSGQGDIEVGRQVWAKFPDHMRGAFIHDVKDMPEAERAPLREAGVHVVDTYVRAAVLAHELGLISQGGLDSVITESAQELDEIAWDSPEQEAHARALREADLPHDRR